MKTLIRYSLLIGYNDRVEIFSETGEFLYQLGVGQLSQPWGIATHGDSLYISCWDDHTVSKFSLTEMWRVRRIGGRGSDNGQFNDPYQLTTDPIGRVFIADTDNHRICIHDPDLNSISVTCQQLSEPLADSVIIPAADVETIPVCSYTPWLRQLSYTQLIEELSHLREYLNSVID